MKQILDIKIEHLHDDDPDTSWLGKYSTKKEKFAIDRKMMGVLEHRIWEYQYFIPANPPTSKCRRARSYEWKFCLDDFWTMEKINRGDIWFIGIRAVARILVNDTIETIHSGGLYGIEQPSLDNSHVEEVEQEQMKELYDILKQLGFKDSDILASSLASEEA